MAAPASEGQTAGASPVTIRAAMVDDVPAIYAMIRALAVYEKSEQSVEVRARALGTDR